jgi:hypothetical protein
LSDPAIRRSSLAESAGANDPRASDPRLHAPGHSVDEIAQQVAGVAEVVRQMR